VAKFSIVIPPEVTREIVLAPTFDPPPAVRLGGVAIVKSARANAQRNANRPIERRKLQKPDRDADFLFIDQTSDERMILVLCESPNQRISPTYYVGAAAELARRWRMSPVAVRTCRGQRPRLEPITVFITGLGADAAWGEALATA